MKTEELIELLAADTTPVQPRALEQRFALATLVGLLGSSVLLLALFGIRPDLEATMVNPMFWAKLLFAATLATAGLLLLRKLSRPGVAVHQTPWLLAVPVLAVWVAAVMALWGAPPEARLPLVLGSTWRTCPFNIAALSAPALAAGLWALRGGAPTHLAAAGATAGAFAGGLAAMVYALHCPEMAAPFLAVWYVAGMAIPTAAGAWLGPRMLHW